MQSLKMVAVNWINPHILFYKWIWISILKHVTTSNESYEIRNIRTSTQIPATTRISHCAVKCVRLIFVVVRKEIEIIQISQDGNGIYLQESFQKSCLLQW